MVPFLSMWMMVKEGGWGAMLALLVGSLGIILGIVSLGLLPIARKVGHALGVVTLLLAFLAPAVGLLGMASGRRMTESAISGESVGPGMKIRIRREGYLESQQAAKVGFGAGVLPLLLGAAAAFAGARRKPEDPPSSFRWVLAGAGTAIALLTCSGALAATFGPLPPDISYDESRLLDARAAYDADPVDGCTQLEEALRPYWHASDKKEWPRHFDPDPHKVVPDLDAIANKCIEMWKTRGTRDDGTLLTSPLLLDADQKKSLVDRESILAHDPFGGWSNDTAIGDAFGFGGLGDAGVGAGAGRREGIGLGNIGTIGTLDGGTQGFGGGHSNVPSHTPTIRQGATSVAGRLPPEVIQRVVRQNFGRFRVCYENGLKTNPALQGSVVTRFVIGRDGSVSTVSDSGSTMPDAGVISCVTKGFYGLSFPQPEGGIVTVTYPIHFTPGD